jgi:hypothetical protein
MRLEDDASCCARIIVCRHVLEYPFYFAHLTLVAVGRSTSDWLMAAPLKLHIVLPFHFSAGFIALSLEWVEHASTGYDYF